MRRPTHDMLRAQGVNSERKRIKYILETLPESEAIQRIKDSVRYTEIESHKEWDEFVAWCDLEHEADKQKEYEQFGPDRCDYDNPYEYQQDLREWQLERHTP